MFEKRKDMSAEKEVLVFKRKFRWTFHLYTEQFGEIPEKFVKLLERPKLELDEDNAVKEDSKRFTVSYYDIANDTELTKLWNWISYYFTDQAKPTLEDSAKVRLYDGLGEIMEEWTYEGVKPVMLDFGELSYSSTEACDINLTCSFKNVIRKEF